MLSNPARLSSISRSVSVSLAINSSRVVDRDAIRAGPDRRMPCRYVAAWAGGGEDMASGAQLVDMALGRPRARGQQRRCRRLSVVSSMPAFLARPAGADLQWRKTFSASVQLLSGVYFFTRHHHALTPKPTASAAWGGPCAAFRNSHGAEERPDRRAEVAPGQSSSPVRGEHARLAAPRATSTGIRVLNMPRVVTNQQRTHHLVVGGDGGEACDCGSRSWRSRSAVHRRGRRSSRRAGQW